MNMQKALRSKTRRYFLQSIAAIIGAAAVFACLVLFILSRTDRRYYVEIEGADGSYKSIEMSQEGIVEITDIKETGDALGITLEPLSKGTCYLSIGISDVMTQTLPLKVTAHGIIKNTNTGDFSGSGTILLCISLFTLTLAVIMWLNYYRAKRNLYFSYHPMFYGGFGIWVSVMGIYQLINVLRILTDPHRFSDNSFSVITFFIRTAASGFYLMLILTPFLLIFALFMVLSNLSLMRHESRRPANALGMALGILLIIGEAVILAVTRISPRGSLTHIMAWNTAVNSAAAFFSAAECLLIGAILSGWSAAKKEPKYDKDFIIILGCRVKKDGTLYPLIKGRVDRAITFYRKQLEQTGKKAVFVPSGGKGSDENISEGEAMKRYLLEQGIPEEQILAETKSKNTLENMKFSGKLIYERIPGAKIVFSTTNYHVFRSGILSVQAGIETDGMGSKTKWYFWPNAFIREFFGLVAYCRIKILLLSALIIGFLAIIQYTLSY